MKTHPFAISFTRAPVLGAMLIAFALPLLTADAQGAQRKNPASKLFVTDVSGEAEIDTGDTVKELAKRSVYNAEGTTIETKKAEKAGDKDKISSSLVYSNGTGAFFGQDTRVEVKRFVQEPFAPNRTDMDVEPSISQTQAFVSRGLVGLCTSKLVAGSTMNYNTPHGSVNILGRKVVIEANDNETNISMLEGDSTVRGGPADLGGQPLHAGERAIIRAGPPGQPNIVRVIPIPPNEIPALDDKVSQACMAKKTVYFEVKERTIGSDPAADAAGSSNSAASDAPVTAFDGPVANADPSAANSNVVREIVPVEVVPTALPVQFTVSPATLISPAPNTGG
jgi:hypothetical protein